SAAEQAWVDGEKEAPRLELVVFDLAVDRLQRAITDREDAIPDDVSLLLGENRLHTHRADFRDRLDSVVAAGNAGGDVARRRRLERDVADFQFLEELVALPLIVDRNVVGGVELALGVVIEIDVHAIGDYSAGFCCELKINQRLEGAPAIGDGVEEERRGAERALILFAANLEATIELKSEVGVLAKNRQRLGSYRWLRFRRQLAGITGRGSSGGEVARRDLPPHRLHDGAHVLLERGGARSFDLGLGLPE